MLKDNAQKKNQPGLVGNEISMLQRWRQKQEVHALGQIPRQTQTEALPLSFAQERIWFLQQMEPASTVYHLPIAYRLVGALNVSLLEESLAVLEQRHAALRTCYTEVNGQPVQRISAQQRRPLSLIDLQELRGNSDFPQHLKAVLAADYQIPFDLERGPLFRATLYKLQEQEHMLLLTLHHLITDGWSNGLLMEDLGALYTALATGQALPPAPEGLQFVDLACWERARWQRGEMDEALAYWKRQLATAPALLQLPLDAPRPAVRSNRGAVYNFQLADETVAKLRALCRAEHVTSVMALLAVFLVFLARYTAQEDLLVGLPVWNRQRKQAENVLGLFVNTLAIRISLAHQPDFRTLLERVRVATLEAYQHQEYPFEKLVEQLRPERTTSHTPLFQVMLSVDAGADEQLSWPGLILLPENVERVGAQVDLTLEITEHHQAQNGFDGFTCAFVYATDLFTPATIERMIGHFSQLLQACVAQPDTKIARLPILSQRELQQMTVDWNATQVIYQDSHFLPRLFEKQVERTPHEIALTYKQAVMTYCQLDERANQLANFLMARGVTSETLVGISVERSLEMVIGLLGILKAGAAYLPLDPYYPPQRLEYMLKDAQVPMLLTQSHLAERFAAMTMPLVCLDEDWQRIARFSQELPAISGSPEQLAYVIYTSGSTGKPKGVMNTHRGVCNRLLWMQDHYQLTGQDRVLQKTPFSFDVSVWEFFWPLITGARLVMAEPERHKDTAYLVEIIKSAAITTLHFVPSMLQLMLDEPGLEECFSLRRVICSGEALSPLVQTRFYQRSQAQLSNLYGPTEAAIDVSYWECQRGDQSKTVAIGFPLANTRLYVLDHLGQPVPIGVPGELHIGGVQVARGYLNKPEQTAEKFIPDPFSVEPTARLYKTGDIARYRADGALEYLGRMDHQVKIRGLRIELEEIEMVLMQHPAVREAVAITRELAPGDTRLVAYLIPTSSPMNQGDSLDVEEIQRYLSARLPDYMVPRTFMILESLPLSPNGKFDRQRLPQIMEETPSQPRAYVPPSNDIERTIAEIWGEILHLQQISIESNFFELGGHSLLVTQMRSKLRERLHVELSIMEAFRFTTIQTLARHVSQSSRSAAWSVQNIRERAARQRQAFKRKHP
ncbi:non-ribosomal peptide synthetase [Ktedonosporobacter rubrisoli]|nr:non-ribosomal peptide synthetase [Ktedonosporobacter rubrisoli]